MTITDPNLVDLLVNGGDETWRLDALCNGLPPVEADLFFPLGDDWNARGHAERAADAKEYCSRCPVRGECLAMAVRTGDRWAVAGGTTPDERRDWMHAEKARRAAAAVPPPVEERYRGQPTERQAEILVAALGNGGFVHGPVSNTMKISLIRHGWAVRLPDKPARRGHRLTAAGEAIARPLAAARRTLVDA